MKILLEEELKLLTSESFFHTKRSLENKILDQLNEASQNIGHLLNLNSWRLPSEINSIAPKISKGQNYLGFPWMILDHPRVFSKNDVFAIRTLCWWTQGISCTMHLSGKYFRQYIPEIRRKNEVIRNSDLFIGINDDPWLHHFGNDNFTQIKSSQFPELLLENTEKRGFIKLMRRFPITDVLKLPDHAHQFTETCLDFLF